MNTPIGEKNLTQPKDYFYAGAIQGGSFMGNITPEYVRSLEEDIRLSDEAETQYKTQIEMLEREVDRLNVIVDALVKAIKIIDRG